ncbi:hypothetical protein HK096_003656, partial [Nowakowskiella sp. JEL0078]
MIPLEIVKQCLTDLNETGFMDAFKGVCIVDRVMDSLQQINIFRTLAGFFHRPDVLVFLIPVLPSFAQPDIFSLLPDAPKISHDIETLALITLTPTAANGLSVPLPLPPNTHAIHMGFLNSDSRLWATHYDTVVAEGFREYIYSPWGDGDGVEVFIGRRVIHLDVMMGLRSGLAGLRDGKVPTEGEAVSLVMSEPWVNKLHLIPGLNGLKRSDCEFWVEGIAYRLRKIFPKGGLIILDTDALKDDLADLVSLLKLRESNLYESWQLCALESTIEELKKHAETESLNKNQDEFWNAGINLFFVSEGIIQNIDQDHPMYTKVLKPYSYEAKD